MLSRNLRLPRWGLLVATPRLLILSLALVPACSEGESGVGAPTGTAPEAAIQPIQRQVGDVTIDYTLQDGESDLVDIHVEYSLDGGTTFSLATEAGGDGVTALASDPVGVQHTFAWGSLADIGPGAETQVVIAITPSDARAGEGQPALSTVFPVGNDAPWLQLPGDVPDTGGAVSVTYDLFDTTSDSCDLAVQFSSDGGVSFSRAIPTILSGDTSQLSSSPTGVTQNFVWDALADLGAGTFGRVVLRLTPSDLFDVGPFTLSNVFRVGPNTAPTAVIQPVARQVDPIQIDFDLFDADSDPIDVLFEYSPDSGQTFAPMTLSPGSPTTGLASSPTGTAHQVIWESASDIGTSAATVQLRVIPSDAFGSGPASKTSDFTVGNDPPEVIIAPIPSPQTGDVIVNYTLIDSTSDPVDIVVEYSTDLGVTFMAATESGGLSEGTQGLASSPAGVPHVYVWDSLADMGFGTHTVLIRITPHDGIAPGAPATSNSFVLVN